LLLVNRNALAPFFVSRTEKSLADDCPGGIQLLRRFRFRDGAEDIHVVVVVVVAGVEEVGSFESLRRGTSAGRADARP
jgi:hypothetical protein